MRQRPEIIAFITSYFPAVGGAEVALRQVADRLSGDFDFLIVTARARPGSPKFEVAPEGRIWRLGVGGSVDKWILPATAWAVRSRVERLRSNGREAVFWGVDTTQASLSASFLRALHSHTPFVLTLQYGEGPHRLTHGRWGLIRRSFEFMLRQADHVTAISSWLLDLARAHGYAGRTSLIPNGVDIQRFRRTTVRPPQEGPVVVTVSRLVKKNGVDNLLRAMAVLVKDFPDVQCRIIGDGPELRPLMRLCADLGLASCVRFYGQVPHEAVPGQLWQGDIFVRPSRSEGMGTAFVEAMAAGLPVVGTSVGGVAEVIQDGETGLLATQDHPHDLARKIGVLLKDRALAATLARQGLAMVEKRYDAEVVVRRYAEVFREALRG